MLPRLTRKQKGFLLTMLFANAVCLFFVSLLWIADKLLTSLYPSPQFEHSMTVLGWTTGWFIGSIIIARIDWTTDPRWACPFGFGFQLLFFVYPAFGGVNELQIIPPTYEITSILLMTCPILGAYLGAVLGELSTGAREGQGASDK